MNKEQWQAYNHKVAEIRRVANIALDKAEEKFKQRINEERKAFIDEATRIATDIIEKERRNLPKTQTEGEPMKEPEKKPEVEMTPENIKILHQMGEIQSRKKEESDHDRHTEKKEKEAEKRGEDSFDKAWDKAEKAEQEEIEGVTEEEDEEETEEETEEEEIEGLIEEPEIDEELEAPEPDDPADQEERVRKAMEMPKIYPPLGQKGKAKEMPNL